MLMVCLAILFPFCEEIHRQRGSIWSKHTSGLLASYDGPLRPQQSPEIGKALNSRSLASPGPHSLWYSVEILFFLLLYPRNLVLISYYMHHYVAENVTNILAHTCLTYHILPLLISQQQFAICSNLEKYSPRRKASKRKTLSRLSRAWPTSGGIVPFPAPSQTSEFLHLIPFNMAQPGPDPLAEWGPSSLFLQEKLPAT